MFSRFLLAGLVVCISVSSAQADTIVLSNAAGGDAYTNAGPSNQGQAVGSSGWFYNNVRNGATVGINGAQPRSGNGSVQFLGADGADKADIEYLASPVNVGGNFFASWHLGLLSNLTDVSYDWYRAGTSTTNSGFHPSLRVLVDRDGDLNTTGDRGGLVFERAYNGGGVQNDTWTTDTISAGTFLWNFGLGLGNEFNINSTPYAYDATFAEWQAYMPNAVVLGFSSGIGSGWVGTFTGNVDNIAWTFRNSTTVRNNFEVPAVPEPATLALLGVALVGLARRRR